jgi:hypothetical protein
VVPCPLFFKIIGIENLEIFWLDDFIFVVDLPDLLAAEGARSFALN